MDGVLQEEIEKRFTLNWLIQGSAQHVGMSLSHLVADELGSVHPELVKWYDQLAIVNQLQYWRPLGQLILGSPWLFWRGARRSSKHPFFQHPLLARYGWAMAKASRIRAAKSGREKRVWQLPVTFSFHTVALTGRIRAAELRAPQQITAAAKRAAAQAWGFDESRLSAFLSPVATGLAPFAPLRRPVSIPGRIFLASAAGWSGVQRRSDGQLIVKATAVNGYFLAKELVKGVAELICLHGLSSLDDGTYEAVMTATDRVDLEPPMLHSSRELWSRFLRAMPAGLKPAEALMHLAMATNRTINP